MDANLIGYIEDLIVRYPVLFFKMVLNNLISDPILTHIALPIPLLNCFHSKSLSRMLVLLKNVELWISVYVPS